MLLAIGLTIAAALFVIVSFSLITIGPNRESLAPNRWFVLLLGAEMNAKIEHALVEGKNPGEKVEGEKRPKSVQRRSSRLLKSEL